MIPKDPSLSETYPHSVQAMVSAVNPVFDKLSYLHKYATKECKETCHGPDNIPPPGQCSKWDYTLTISVISATTSEPVTTATVRVTDSDQKLGINWER